MNKQLERLCESGDFEDIYRALVSKPGNVQKSISLTDADITRLRKLSSESILGCLYSGKKIPDSLLKVAMLLGEEWMASLKVPVCNYIVSQRMADVSQFIALNFQDPGSAKLIFDFIEKSVETMMDRYDSIPQEWNVDLRVVTKSFVMVKQMLCEHFYNNDASPDSFTRGLLSTISFERKLDQFFSLKKCCATIMDLGENEIHVHGEVKHIKCLHRRMLSSVFVPHLEVFYQALLGPHTRKEVDLDSTQKSIVRDFILFFRDLEFVYERVLHFEDRTVLLQLFETADSLLLGMVQKLKPQESMDGGVRIVSTLMYVQEVAQEFSHRINDTLHDCESSALAASRRLEREQSARIERILGSSLSIVEGRNFQTFRTVFETFLSMGRDVPEETRGFILEIATSQLLAKIGLARVNSCTASILLEDVVELEHWLSSMFVFVPHTKTIKDYLRILSCPLEPREGFVANFRALSNGRFSFHQVLKALDDQQAASELFEIYERTLD